MVRLLESIHPVCSEGVSYLVGDVGGRYELEEVHDLENGGHSGDKDEHGGARRPDRPGHLHRQIGLQAKNLPRRAAPPERRRCIRNTHEEAKETRMDMEGGAEGGGVREGEVKQALRKRTKLNKEQPRPVDLSSLLFSSPRPDTDSDNTASGGATKEGSSPLTKHTAHPQSPNMSTAPAKARAYLGGNLSVGVAGGELYAIAGLLQDLAVGELLGQLVHVHLPVDRVSSRSGRNTR